MRGSPSPYGRSDGAWLRRDSVNKFLAPMVGGVLLALLTSLVNPTAVPVRAQTTFTAIATIGIFADFARQVGGDRVEVIQLLGDGVDPHDYQMVPNDLANINRSQLLLY